jgi:D-alanine--D-alanine ligase
MKNSGQIKIILLGGGAASEREISKQSSRGIYDALVGIGYKVAVIDPALGAGQLNEAEKYFETDEKWGEYVAHHGLMYKANDAAKNGNGAQGNNRTNSQIKKSATNYTGTNSQNGKETIDEIRSRVSFKNYIDAIKLPVFDEADLVFNGLHGRWGEDGQIQSLLQLRGKKYTGPGVLACALAMDKGKSKIIYKNSGVIVPNGFNRLKNSFNFDESRRKVLKEFGFPVIVKPNDEGSTFGLTLVEKEDQLEEAFNFAFEFSDNVLVEEYIAGRELTVGVLDGEALPALEIRPKHGLYDFECKYTGGMSEYLVPAPVDEDVSQFMQQQALLAYNSIGCSGYARIDFRLSPENKPYCLELNSLPGMTKTSLMPKMAKEKGMSYSELVDKIVRISL